MITVLSLMFFGLAMSAAQAPSGALEAGTKLDTALIERLTGAKGKLDEKEGVFKVSVPRSDLAVTAAGVRLAPPMGLTSWAAFQRAGAHTMVMGDMVLLEDQVDGVMSAALDNGLDVTALHNHFSWESPRVMFMHIGGMGEEETLASAVGAVFARIKQSSAEQAKHLPLDVDPAARGIDARKIDAILGAAGEMNGGVYKVTIGRQTTMDGVPLGGSMGVNTWAAFAGSDERAVVDGDFAMLESELQDVLRTLRKAGVSVVAIHSHMSGEQPRILFLHYWAVGRTADLAGAIKAALDKTRHSPMRSPG
jgi:hypothetical protein